MPNFDIELSNFLLNVLLHDQIKNVILIGLFNAETINKACLGLIKTIKFQNLCKILFAGCSIKIQN